MGVSNRCGKQALLTCRWPDRRCWESSKGVRSRGFVGDAAKPIPGCPPAAAPLPTEPLNEPLPLFFASCHVMFNSGPAVPALPPPRTNGGREAGPGRGSAAGGRAAPGWGVPRTCRGKRGRPRAAAAPPPTRSGVRRVPLAAAPPGSLRLCPRAPGTCHGYPPPQLRKSFCEILLGSWEGPGWDLCG